MKVSAIIAAAGRGERIGKCEYPSKVLVPLGGRTSLDRVLEAFHFSTLVNEVILVVPAHLLAYFQNEVKASRFGAKVLKVVEGGQTRGESVRCGLMTIGAEADVVVIHDCARPFVTPELIDNVARKAFIHGAAISAVRVVDTVKISAESDQEGRRVAKGTNGGDVPIYPGPHARCIQVEGNDEPAMAEPITVDRTVDRDRVWLAQTPQAFKADILKSAYDIDGQATHRSAWKTATDDSSLVEALGVPVVIEPGDVKNIKITHPEDIDTARMWLSEYEPQGRPGTQAGSEFRIGLGYDIHRLVEGRRLVLGGVDIPFDKGLLGHSDADVLCHAISDALLGAASLGDIGHHFPDSDERYRGARSVDLLTEVASMVRAEGWEISNIDSVLVAEEPRISPYVNNIRNSLSCHTRIRTVNVSVKATTNEGLGTVGRRECIAALAVVAIVRP